MPLSRDEKYQEVRDYIIEKATEQKQLDRRVVNRRAAVSAGRDALFLEDLDESLKKVFRRGWAVSKKYGGRLTKGPLQRTVHVVISDTHFQSLLDPRECPQPYGPVEESRRLGKVASQVAEYKRDHRKDTRLSVKLLGDLIQNQLHDAREGSPLTLQVAACIEYLVRLLLFWSSQYGVIDVYCTPGNHGRNKYRHHERAVQQKWDSIETIIYLAVKQALAAAGAKHVTVNIPMTPYIVEECYGQKIFWTHGDTVFKTGYPGNKIDIGSLHSQILRWNSARHVNGPFKLFGCGHVHIGSMTRLAGGVMLTNGCLVPPDAHAVSIGAADVVCGQYIFESTPGHVVGDDRFVEVEDADSEPGYNEIIPPFSGGL
jgi:hypothetical protein